MKRFFRIFCLWSLFYFLMGLNFLLSEWSHIGQKQYRVSLKLLQIEFEEGKKDFWQALDEINEEDLYDLKWAEKFRSHFEAGIGLIVFEIISLLFLVIWEKMKYYKNLEDWKIKEKIMVFLSVLFKVFGVGFWWSKTRCSLNSSCEFLVIGDRLQSPCVGFGFGIELCLCLVFIVNILISVSL